MRARHAEQLRRDRPPQPRILDERRESGHDQLVPELTDRGVPDAPDWRVERVHAQPELGGDRGDLEPSDRATAREQARADRKHQRRPSQQLVDRRGRHVAHAPIGPTCGRCGATRGARQARRARGHGVTSPPGHVDDARIPTPIPTPRVHDPRSEDSHAFLACASKGVKGVGIGVGIRGRKSPQLAIQRVGRFRQPVRVVRGKSDETAESKGCRGTIIRRAL